MRREFLPEPVAKAARKLLRSLRHRRKTLRRSWITAAYISPVDVYEIPRLTMQGLAAWTLPQALWWPLSRLLGRLNVASHPRRTQSEIADIASLLGASLTMAEAREIAVANWANRYEERFHYLRSWRPGGWNPVIDIDGAEHITAARVSGRGIVFWGGNFSFSYLVSKMAMHRLGLVPTLFSVSIHGISNTPFGTRYLNRLYRNIENRYLRERVVPEGNDFPAALQYLRQRIAAGDAVYFAVGGRGRRTATVRFLESHIRIATGPVAVARETGAALLPLHTFRAGSARFQVTVGPPVEIPKDKDGKADYTSAVQAYADALTPFVLRDPGQWNGWHLVRERTPWHGDRVASARPKIRQDRNRHASDA